MLPPFRVSVQVSFNCIQLLRYFYIISTLNYHLSNIITITYDVYIIGIFPIIWNMPDDNYILSGEFYNRIYIIGLVVVDCLAVLELAERAFARPVALD